MSMKFEKEDIKIKLEELECTPELKELLNDTMMLKQGWEQLQKLKDIRKNRELHMQKLKEQGNM